MWDIKRGDNGEQSGRGRRQAVVAGMDAAEWVRRELRFEADALQAEVLRTRSKRGLLNCCRQWGKSTITAAKAIHQAQAGAESLTLVVIPGARMFQSTPPARAATAEQCVF